MFDWHEAIADLRPSVFRISTPDGTGTGWLMSRSKASKLTAIATAAHVIDHAHYWEEPIRLHHVGTGATRLLRPDDRSINIDYETDTAAILFNREDLDLPEITRPLIEKDHFLKPGVEIGWLGFPAVSSGDLCFFSGRISAYLEEKAMYLVDGVAINGVSGGPAFRLLVDKPELIGVVSAYIANRATGEILPGVAVVRDVNRFHDLTERFKSLDEAQEQQTPPSEPPPPAQDAATPSSRGAA